MWQRHHQKPAERVLNGIPTERLALVALSRHSHRMRVGETKSFTRFSAMLRLFAATPRDRIAVSELVEAIGDRGFGAVMLLLALPNLVPLPPGASAVFGLPLILVAAQLAVGRRALWLPRFVLRRSIRTSVFSRIVAYTRPALRRAERLLAPRLAFMVAPLSLRLAGFACVLMAILIALPIPLANFLSGLAVSVFALGLLRHDGVAIALGWGAAIVSVVATVLVSGALWLAVRDIAEWLSRIL